MAADLKAAKLVEYFSSLSRTEIEEPWCEILGIEQRDTRRRREARLEHERRILGAAHQRGAGRPFYNPHT
jgi:hypothetical protein